MCLSSLGVPGVHWHPQILVDQLTFSQLGGVDYAHHITTGIPRFSDLNPIGVIKVQVKSHKTDKCVIGSTLNW